MWLIILMLVGTIGSLFIAFIALLKNPHQPKYRWFFMFLFAANLWVLAANLQGALDPEFNVGLSRLGFVSASCLGYFMLRFVISYCQLGYSRRWQIIDLAAVTASTGLSLSPLVIQKIESVHVGSVTPVRGFGYPVVVGLILFLVVRALVLLNSYRLRSQGRRRSQLNLVGSGLLVGIVVGIITNVILPNVTRTTYYSRYAFLVILLWTALFFYAIWRQRFLDVRWAAARTVVYALSVISIAGLYLLGVNFIISHTADQTQVDVLDVYYLVATIVAAVFFAPLRQFFDKVTNRIFYRNRYILQDVFDTLGKVLSETVDVEYVMSESTTLLRNVIKSDHMDIVLVNGYGSHKEWEKELRKEFADLPKQVVLGDDIDDEYSPERRFLKHHKIAAVAPLQTSDSRIGYLVVGYKRDGRLFSQQDVDLIRLAADQIAVAMQNALSVQEVKDINATLQERIEDATKKLRANNAQLQRLDAAKDEFVSMASHQLRTPLTSVKGYISMVLEGDVGKITPTQRRLLGEAFTSSERMVHLINDFLNVSRIQTGKFIVDRRPVDLTKVVAQEVDSLQTTAKARSLTLTYRPPSYFPILYVDESKLRQVMMNFIDNAIYYSHENTTIMIELRVEGSDAVFRVRDTGIGVPKGEQAHIFTKFFRATNARKQRPDGTGVGLFLAKKIIDAHEGTITLESVEDEGSTFGFQLPIKKLSSVPAHNTN